jgi:hypothetical protein
MHRLGFLSNMIWVAAALISLSLVAVQPFTRSQMLLSDDAALHLYRIIVLDHSLRYDHPIYPRFSSALAYGYGAPLFNYFSPFAYYLPRTLHLFGMSFVSAWLAAMVVYLWIAALGAFLLGRTLTNIIGGFVAAVAYLYSPYLLYDAVSRGTITEVAGLAVLPFVLYALTRLARAPSLSSFSLAVISYSIFIPLHNIITLHGSLLIFVYGLFLVVASTRPLRTTALLASTGLLSVGMTGFFWLPALGETQWIKLPAITAQLSHLDVTRHLRDLSEVLAVPAPVDPHQQQAPIPITVSWPALLTALLGSLCALKLKLQRAHFLFWGSVAAFTLFMNTPASAWVWQHVPLMHYTQFAWRILGITSIALAALCALSVYAISELIPRSHFRTLLAYALIMGFVLYALPFTYRPTQLINGSDVLSAQRHERLRSEVALSSYGEYLPLWTADSLDPDALTMFWESSPVIPRWTDREGILIEREAWAGTSAALQVVLEEARPVTLAWSYMPNWSVRVNSIYTTVYPDEDGLVTFDLPQGRSSVIVEYALSDLQRAGIAISAIAVIIFAATLVVWFFVSHGSATSAEALPKPFLIGCIVVGIGLIGLKTAYIDQTNNLWHHRRWTDGHFDQVPVLDTVFNHELSLLSADISVSQNNSSITVSTYWAPLKQISRDYGILYSIRDRSGIEIKRHTRHQLAGLDTSRWLVGLYLEENVVIEIPKGTLPGDYSVFVSIYDREVLLPTINSAGNPDRPEINIGVVNLQPSVQKHESENLNTPLSLFNVEGLPDSATEGSFFDVTLTWLTGRLSREAYSYALRWQGESGDVTISEYRLLAPEFPTNLWKSSSLFKTPLRAQVPLLNVPGEYRLYIALVDLNQQVVYEAQIGSIAVITPPREFSRPQLEQTTSVKWHNGIELVGYEVMDNEVTFGWRTNRLLLVELRIFVHLVDERGMIIDQCDEVPVNWTRPTTSWLPGEFVVTRCVFDKPIYPRGEIRVGFYDTNSFERVRLGDNTTSFNLPTVAIGN